MDRLRCALTTMTAVTIFGTAGYWLFGLSLLDSVYQTVTTITTVGFSELKEFGSGEKIFTIILIIVGVSTMLYSFTLVVQVVVEGQLKELRGRRRMTRQINKMTGHTIVCGRGRVGAAVAHDLAREGHEVVVIDQSLDRVHDLGFPVVIGDATRGDTLKAAGIERASALIAALDGDAEFIDVVMHERPIEFRMREFADTESCKIAGKTIRAANLREESGALILALRSPGNDEDLLRLENLARSTS
jgi:voltage-gated potassium channel